MAIQLISNFLVNMVFCQKKIICPDQYFDHLFLENSENENSCLYQVLMIEDVLPCIQYQLG